MISREMCSSSTTDLLWELEGIISDGGSPNIGPYLRRCKSSADRADLLSDLISSEIDHLGWDAKRVRNRLRLYAKHDRSRAGVLKVIRGLYADQVKSGTYLPLDAAVSLGVPVDRLQLRVQNELVFLGYELAGRYRLDQVLGLGRIGVVYRAWDLADEKQVAVKTIQGADSSAMRQARILLNQEAKVLQKIRHRGIPEFIARLNEARMPCLVLQYVEGGTLYNLLRRGRLSPKRAARIVAAIADTLDFAHRQGYIHRDLKLANVLLDKAARPYLADFGIALPQSEQFDRDGESGGTCGYMPVESLLGMTSQMDGRADIWSAGVILYELLTGQELTGRGSREEAFVDAVILERRKIKFPKDVPRALAKICEKCLARDPNNRYHTAGLLHSALNRFLAGETHGKV